MLFKLYFILFLSLVTFAQSDTSLVLLKNIDSTFVTDVRYATTNNFTGKILYKSNKVFLRKVVADSLKKTNDYFKKHYNCAIKIFDGYRPLSVQKYMWQILPDNRYVADPSKGSRHNRGAAVDITLIDSLGNQLDMGTKFDDFTVKAHIDHKNLTEEALCNRKILFNGMKKFGFTPISSEWWHFDFKSWKKFSILNILIE